MADGFTDEDNEIIEQIYQEQEHAEQVAQAQANANRYIQNRFHMSPAEFYALSDEQSERLIAEEKASEQRIDKSAEDVEQAPLSPSELSEEQRLKYNRLIEFGSDPVKALAWLEKYRGNYDDFALKAVSKRLLPDDVLRDTAEGVEAKRLLKDYFSELMDQGLSTANIQDYFDMELTRSQAREAIARDRGIQSEAKKFKDAEVANTRLLNRAQAAKWIKEAKFMGIAPSASAIAAKLGCSERDIKDLCE